MGFAPGVWRTHPRKAALTTHNARKFKRVAG